MATSSLTTRTPTSVATRYGLIITALALPLAALPGTPARAEVFATVNYSVVNNEYAVATGCDPCEGLLSIADEFEGKPVTHIGTDAFRLKTDLTGNLIIPDSVTHIGNLAFAGTQGMQGTLSIPNSVIDIGAAAFANTRLTGELAIPNSLESIPQSAFAFATGFSGLTFGGESQLTEIGESAFAAATGLDGQLTIPNTVETIGVSAFEGATNLDGLSFAAGSLLTTIGASAFSGASGLDGQLTIPNSVETVGNNAFDGAGNLDTLILSESMQHINDYAFFNMTDLSGVLTIPAAVTTIGVGAFQNAEKLEGLDFASGSQLTDIGDTAFKGTSSLAGTLTIPSNVHVIGAYAFAREIDPDSNRLSSLILNNSLLAIEASAFEGAIGVTGTFNIPINVLHIGERAFYGVKKFESVRFHRGHKPELGLEAFHGSEAFPIYRKASATGEWPILSLDGNPLTAVNVPTVTANPPTTVASAGANVTLTGTADTHTGGGLALFRWFKNGSAISGATNPTLSLTNVTANDSGTYTLKATSWAGIGTSSSATVTVNTPAPVVPAPAKSSQTAKVKLPATLKKGKSYSLPKTTVQGQKLAWKPAKNQFCAIKKFKLRCTKATKSKKTTITATAPASNTLNPFTLSLARKVK